MKKFIISSLSLLSAAAAYPQFDQSISVEGKYIPEVIRLDRINTFPKKVNFSLESTPLVYDAAGTTAAFAPQLYTVPALGWNDTRKIRNNRGYIDFGLGSWLNSTLSAGYRFMQDENTVVGLRLQHNSTSLWKPEVSPLYSDTKQWRYDETLGVYGSHFFSGYGRLDAAVDYHIGNFNYYGFNPLWIPITSKAENLKKVPNQTLNDISARVGWISASDADQVSWNISLGTRYFGYRRMYGLDEASLAQEHALQLSGVKSTRETDIFLNGGVLFPTSSKSAVGLDLKASVLTYSGFNANDYSFNYPALAAKPDTYGLVTLTPFYRFAINRLNLRLGANIDIAAKAGPEEKRYDLFHFSPDVMLDYDAGPARLFLHLRGGSALHTLTSGYELDYYQQPFIFNTTPVYTPLDGEFGASFGPFSGFSAGLGFAFRVSRGQYLGGWYQQFLNSGPALSFQTVPGGLLSHIGDTPVSYSFLENQTYNISGYSLRADLAYDLGKYFKISANGAYQPQNGKTGFFNGLDRPRWIAAISAQTNPWKTLKLSLSYNYRGVRSSWIKGSYRNDKGFDETILTSLRLPDVTSLDFGASYSFTDSFSLWLQADNILNRHILLLPALPSQGVSVAGGVSILF